MLKFDWCQRKLGPSWWKWASKGLLKIFFFRFLAPSMQSVKFSPGILYWLAAPSKPSTGGSSSSWSTSISTSLSSSPSSSSLKSSSSSSTSSQSPPPTSWLGYASGPSRRPAHWLPLTIRITITIIITITCRVCLGAQPKAGSLAPLDKPREESLLAWLHVIHPGLFSPRYNLTSPAIIFRVYFHHVFILAFTQGIFLTQVFFTYLNKQGRLGTCTLIIVGLDEAEWKSKKVASDR